ncbi:hypothetical protein QBC46DRAFT_406346 [Diplogelasinospora grovesii]|uniref:Secreted protein n=1 Tax=Diplogelasinospora grovesii TaxID=303347 RepID=A0AAN6NBY1_9PEZI|nr:hypothetical protein QBC46DRAFT_406346 [Diplogelasinospora grovesii]
MGGGLVWVAACATLAILAILSDVSRTSPYGTAKKTASPAMRSYRRIGVSYPPASPAAGTPRLILRSDASARYPGPGARYGTLDDGDLAATGGSGKLYRSFTCRSYLIPCLVTVTRVKTYNDVTCDVRNQR